MIERVVRQWYYPHATQRKSIESGLRLSTGPIEKIAIRLSPPAFLLILIYVKMIEFDWVNRMGTKKSSCTGRMSTDQ